MAAVISFSAITNNDKAGLIFFSDKVEKYIPAKKGKEHVLYMLREMITHKAHSSHTDITKAIGYLNSVSKHKSIVFILSDFADAGYERALKAAAKKHDIIGIQVHDKRDMNLPKVGLLKIEDAETGETILLNTKNAATQFEYNRQFKKIQEDAKQNFRLAGADLIQIATGDDYVKALQEFFVKRA